MYVVESRLDADLLEHGHAEDGEDEHDEQEEEGDVDEGGQRHHQREDQRPDPLGRLDEAQDATDLHHADLHAGGSRYHHLSGRIRVGNWTDFVNWFQFMFYIIYIC